MCLALGDLLQLIMLPSCPWADTYAHASRRRHQRRLLVLKAHPQAGPTAAATKVSQELRSEQDDQRHITADTTRGRAPNSSRAMN